MANSVQSNPVYYSLPKGQNTPSRIVELHKRPGHDGFGVYIGEDVPTGIYIVTVERDSPAADADILPGDRVLAVNGQLVSSMSTNPKETLVKEATNAETLTLTLQSTGTYQTLNMPLNDRDNNSTNRESQPHSSKSASVVYDSLESYVQSLFANENVHIVSSSLNSHEFVITSDPHKKSPRDSNSNSSRQHHSNDDRLHRQHQANDEQPHRQHHANDDHRHHHHHKRRDPHRHRKQILRETKETQTSLNEDDEDENIEEIQPVSSVHPPIGTLSTHSDNVSENSATHRTSSPAFAAAPSPEPDSISRDSPVDPHPPYQHLADVVAPLVAASRSPQPKSREQNPGRSAPTRETTPPSVSQPLKKSDSDDTTSTRSSTPPPAEPSPPPYTPLAATNAPPANTNVPADNQATTTNGTPSVFNALANLPHTPAVEDDSHAPKPVRGEGLHEIHMKRVSGFDGFGFQLQYNKTYYLVHGVEEGSPSATAGLLVNDVIHSVNNQTTENMSHAAFVQMVTSSSDVTFTVQNVNEYIRANPQPPRNQQAAAVVAAAITTESEKRKGPLGKTLQKLKSR